jgi:acetate---CoA ligase (ADP-forming)
LLEVVTESDKPVVAWWAAGSLSDPGVKALTGSVVTSFRSPDRCAAAVKSLVKYHQLLRKKADPIPINTQGFPFAKHDAAKLFNSSNTCLSEHESKHLLSLYGIPVTKEILINSKDEAIKVAAQIGFPVVLKVDSPDILHKTEANIISLNINSREEVGASYEKIMINAHLYNPEARINGVVVQEMVFGGTEIIAGISQDPQFGPVIAFGLGGIFVEVLKDISLRVTPLSKSDAEEMVKETKGYAILNGSRKRAPGDIEALVDVLQKLSRLADDLREEISEIDINPIVVLEKGMGVKALDALVIRKMNEEQLC